MVGSYPDDSWIQTIPPSLADIEANALHTQASVALEPATTLWGTTLVSALWNTCKVNGGMCMGMKCDDERDQ